MCIDIATLIREAATTTTTASITRTTTTTTTHSLKEHRNCNRNRNRLAAICCNLLPNNKRPIDCSYIWNLNYIYHIYIPSILTGVSRSLRLDNALIRQRRATGIGRTERERERVKEIPWQIYLYTAPYSTQCLYLMCMYIYTYITNNNNNNKYRTDSKQSGIR